jgi:hypothetical protein
VLRVSVCLFVKPVTRVKTDNLFPVDIDRLEQGCGALSDSAVPTGGVWAVQHPQRKVSVKL